MNNVSDLLQEKLSLLVEKLIHDSSGRLEFEVRFGKILIDGDKSSFSTQVDKDCYDLVEHYLRQDSWVLVEDVSYKQYRIGKKRMRVYDTGRIEAISKKLLSHQDVHVPSGLDVRASLSQEKSITPINIERRSYEVGYRSTFMQDIFRFDLTRLKRTIGNRLWWENRVELEITNSIHTTTPLQSMLPKLVELVLEISQIENYGK